MRESRTRKFIQEMLYAFRFGEAGYAQADQPEPGKYNHHGGERVHKFHYTPVKANLCIRGSLVWNYFALVTNQSPSVQFQGQLYTVRGFLVYNGSDHVLSKLRGPKQRSSALLSSVRISARYDYR